MSKRDWKLFLEDILESIELIEDYIKGMNLDDFRNDRKTIDAVVRNLEIIGEAARNIPDEIKNRYQEIDWRGMIGLRNRIIHEYFGVSTTIIWNILKQEIPPIKEKIKSILK
mgnify:CR=1 FL=1